MKRWLLMLGGLLVWAEYPPLRQVLEHFRALGGRALVGTSANGAGQPKRTRASRAGRSR